MFVVQNELRPAAIQDALRDLMGNGISAVRICCAYVSKSGSELIYDGIVRAAGPGGIDGVRKIIVTSLDYGITEPTALEFWREKPNSSVLVAGAALVRGRSLIPKIAFHPKFYIFEKATGGMATLVSSANLTNRGLTVNAEVGWSQLDHQLPDPVDRAWRAAIETATPLTDEILAAYRTRRRRNRAGARVIERTELARVPTPRLAPVVRYPLFTDAPDSIREFGEMWVESRAVQGGSRNQLELPRGAHRFFGAAFGDYEFERVEHIVELTLISGSAQWADRSVTWHGDNAMERINLPSATQGGFSYGNSLILFRRLAEKTFELRVYPWSSDSARALVEASHKAGLLYRVGRRRNITRLAGFIR